MVVCAGKRHVMAEEIVFQADPFVETCNRLYSKWKVRLATSLSRCSTVLITVTVKLILVCILVRLVLHVDYAQLPYLLRFLRCCCYCHCCGYWADVNARYAGGGCNG